MGGEYESGEVNQCTMGSVNAGNSSLSCHFFLLSVELAPRVRVWRMQSKKSMVMSDVRPVSTRVILRLPCSGE